MSAEKLIRAEERRTIDRIRALVSREARYLELLLLDLASEELPEGGVADLLLETSRQLFAHAETLDDLVQTLNKRKDQREDRRDR